jgi:ATP-dependent helicase STH1/SNF2
VFLLLFCSGTPLQNELPELWSLLNFLHPSIFNSCENFEKWFATPFTSTLTDAKEREKATTMSEEEKLLVINRLHSILRPFMLRREKKHVECDLADKIEKVLRCELSAVQKLVYATIMEGKVGMHNKMIQLRKVVNKKNIIFKFIIYICSYDVFNKLFMITNLSRNLCFCFCFFFSVIIHIYFIHIRSNFTEIKTYWSSCINL